MTDAVGASVTRMMTWRAKAMVLTILLLALGLVSLAFRLGHGPHAALKPIRLTVILWALPLWLFLMRAIFRTGNQTFGPAAHLGYSVLAVVLTPLFGLGVLRFRSWSVRTFNE